MKFHDWALESLPLNTAMGNQGASLAIYEASRIHWWLPRPQMEWAQAVAATVTVWTPSRVDLNGDGRILLLFLLGLWTISTSSMGPEAADSIVHWLRLLYLRSLAWETSGCPQPGHFLSWPPSGEMFSQIVVRIFGFMDIGFNFVVGPNCLLETLVHFAFT